MTNTSDPSGRAEAPTRERIMNQRIEDYRSGYSAGWDHRRHGEPMRDRECAERFFGQQVALSDDDDDRPCGVCGCEERHQRTGLLTCECPAPLPNRARGVPPEALRQLEAEWRRRAEQHAKHGDCYRRGEGWGLEESANELVALLRPAERAPEQTK